ncbi:MAG: ROK family protein [Bacteroidota bacterium]
MKKVYGIGADIGGSHISTAAVELSNGKVLENTNYDISLNNKASSDEIVEKWGTAIQKTIETVQSGDIKGIGLAMPGPFDYVNGISLFDGKTQKYENTYGLNVSKALRYFLQLPENYPIRFINDAAAFAIGESWNGKAKNTNRSLSITLGTGLGSGFIKEELPVFDSENVPEDGFIYHLPFQEGIADDFFSTRGLVKAYYELTGKQVAGVKEIALASETDKAARELMQYFGDQLAQLLAPWLSKFNAEVLVVGGNISRAFYLFGAIMQKRINDSGLNVKVKKSDLSDTSQIIGAARIIDNQYWKKVFPRLIH